MHWLRNETKAVLIAGEACVPAGDPEWFLICLLLILRSGVIENSFTLLSLILSRTMFPLRKLVLLVFPRFRLIQGEPSVCIGFFPSSLSLDAYPNVV